MVIQAGLFADNHFYRTTPMAPAEENKAEREAISQEDRILEHLRETGKEMTAWELKDIFPNWEIVSIRRSLWNLEFKDEKIIQIGWRKERKGVRCGVYKTK